MLHKLCHKIIFNQIVIKLQIHPKTLFYIMHALIY